MKQYADQELRQLMIERYTKPHHFGLTNDPKLTFLKLKSPACSDRLNLELMIENNHLKSLKFSGEACAIAVAAADLLIDQIENQTVETALKIIKNYDLLLQHKGEVDWEMLGELIAFKNIYQQKGRIRCASLTSRELEQYLENYLEANGDQ